VNSLSPSNAHLLSSLIRWIHVLSMAFLLGGSGLLWAAASASSLPTQNGQPNRLFQSLALIYERLAWLSNGLLVLTGVGNLAVFEAGLPGWGTPWGNKLVTKLLVVLFYLIFSLVRSLAVIRMGAEARLSGSSGLHRILSILYAGTLLMVALILALAVRLAHG
jgi:putative copper export protein